MVGARGFELSTGDHGEFHPAIAVILNITPDHLDRHGTFENYAMAKERIFAKQDENDYLVLNADDARTASCGVRAQVAGVLVLAEHWCRRARFKRTAW